MSADADAAQAGEERDAACVEITTPLAPADLRDFLADVERLFRINPLIEFAEFTPIGGGRYHTRSSNLSNGRDSDLILTVTGHPLGLDVGYSQGLKTATSFRVEPHREGSRLIVTDVYGGASEEARRARLAEVDGSLNAWGRALHEYLRRWARWRWLPLWRWYMARVWQPMKPSARRIVWMLWIISLFELATILAVLLVWLAAQRISS